MKELLFRFLREEGGQDLVEYTLLLAFVCLASGRVVHQRWPDHGQHLGAYEQPTAMRAVGCNTQLELEGPTR